MKKEYWPSHPCENRSGGRSKGKVTHKDVCIAVAKISAYLRVSNKEESKKWAYKLVGYLVDLELLPPRNEE